MFFSNLFYISPVVGMLLALYATRKYSSLTSVKMVVINGALLSVQTAIAFAFFAYLFAIHACQKEVSEACLLVSSSDRGDWILMLAISAVGGVLVGLMRKKRAK